MALRYSTAWNRVIGQFRPARKHQSYAFPDLALFLPVLVTRPTCIGAVDNWISTVFGGMMIVSVVY